MPGLARMNIAQKRVLRARVEQPRVASLAAKGGIGRHALECAEEVGHHRPVGLSGRHDRGIQQRSEPGAGRIGIVRRIISGDDDRAAITGRAQVGENDLHIARHRGEQRRPPKPQNPFCLNLNQIEEKKAKPSMQ